MPRLYEPEYLATRRRRVSRLRTTLDLVLVFGILAIGVADWASGAVAALVLFIAWLGILAINLAIHA